MLAPPKVSPLTNIIAFPWRVRLTVVFKFIVENVVSKINSLIDNHGKITKIFQVLIHESDFINAILLLKSNFDCATQFQNSKNLLLIFYIIGYIFSKIKVMLPTLYLSTS